MFEILNQMFNCFDRNSELGTELINKCLKVKTESVMAVHMVYVRHIELSVLILIQHIP